jgi:hypothetical protein
MGEQGEEAPVEGRVALATAVLLPIVIGVSVRVEFTKAYAGMDGPSASATSLSSLAGSDRQVFYHLEEGSEVFPSIGFWR